MADTVHLLQSQFSRGEVSPFLFGRVDTTAYTSGLRTLRNMFVRPEGAVSNRQAFGFVNNAITNTSKASILMPFVFSASQSYVLEIGALSAHVLSNGNVVTGAAFATPWAAADLWALRWSQSSDTLSVFHPNYPTYEIKRTSANSFTCLQAVYTGGPFLPQNTDGTTFVYASALTGTVTLTSTAAIFNANQVGGLMQLTQQDLSTIPPWEPTKKFTDASGTSVNPVGLYRRASLKNYKCVAVIGSAAPWASGTIIPTHSQGTQTDGDGSTIPNLAVSAGVSWQYQDSGFGVVLITGYISPTQVTAMVQPNYVGGPSLLPTACVGGPITTVGPFSFSATAGQTVFAMGTSTSTDPTKFYVTVNGIYISPSAYTISTTNLQFLAGQAAGAAVVIRQVTALGSTTYWAFGAFSVDQGFPSTGTYYPDRLVMASTPKQPVGVFGSQTSQYHNFAVSSPVVASDAFTVFLNARQLNAISDLIPLSDLLVGTSNITWRLWAGQTGTAIGPLSIASTPQSYYGQSPNCAALLFGDSAIYPEYDGRRLRDMLYQFAYDKFQGQELTLYSRHLIPFGTEIVRLAYKPDTAAPFMFALRNDGALLCCTYLRDQQITGWSHWDTQGTFEDICVVPEARAFGLYAIVNRIINGVRVRYIERLVSREVSTIFDYKFADCLSTYDGRNTSTTSMTLTGGTTWMAGDTGTITASSTAGWANFLPTDVTVNNEIWISVSLAFTTLVSKTLGGTLVHAVTPGSYTFFFSDGSSRSVIVAIDGVTCSWSGPLASMPISTANVRCRLLLTGYLSATACMVRLKDPCPVNLQNSLTTTWTFARTKLTGASQLAGMQCVAFVDGCVVGISSLGVIPNGSVTVGTDGSIALPLAGGVVQVGLSYLSDFETLSLNDQGQETIRMRAKTNPVVYLDVTESRNFLVGTDFSTVTYNQERAFEAYTAPTNIQEGVLYTRINSELTAECHSCIRQNMPLPLTIRMHIPQVTIADPIS